MKTILLSLFLLCIISSNKSQFMPDSDATWEVYGKRYEPSVSTSQAEDHFLYRYQIEGDTVINGLTYNKLNLNGYLADNTWNTATTPNPSLVNVDTIYFSEYFGGIRELDSAVYFIDSNNVETLVMKFNVSAGDMLYSITPEQSHYNICNFGYDADTILIDSIRDQMVNGLNFRTVFAHDIATNTDETFSQNIGKSHGLFWNYYTDVSNCFIFSLNSLCWEGDSYLLDWNSDISFDGNCSFMNVSSKQHDKLILYPNPTSSSIFFSLDPDLNWSKIQVLNMLGQVVYTVYSSSELHEVNMSTFEEGTYFLTVFGEDNYLYTEKIIKMD